MVGFSVGMGDGNPLPKEHMFMTVYDVKFNGYNELLKFCRENFPRRGGKIPFWDACVFILLWASNQDRDRAVFQHVRRRGGGYEFSVDGNPRKIGSQTMTKCIDHLEKLGLVAVSRGFYLRDRGVWERGKTVVDVARLKKMLGGHGECVSLNGSWKPVIKVDGVAYESYREFCRVNGKSKFVAEVWKRVRGLKSLYDGMRVSFPQDPHKMPLEMLQTVWDRYLDAQSQKPAGKAILEPEKGIRDIWDKVSEWENRIRSGGVLSGAVRDGSYGRVYSKMSGIPKYLVPMVRIGGEWTYELDAVSCVPQILMQKAGTWGTGTDVYEVIRESLGRNGVYLDRDQVKLILLYGINVKNQNQLAGKIFSCARNPYDYCVNLSESHRAVLNGTFHRAVSEVFPEVADAMFNKHAQHEVIRVESGLFLDTAIRVFRETGKRVLYRFDSLLIPESLDPKVVGGIIDGILSGILGREAHLDVKIKGYGGLGQEG